MVLVCRILTILLLLSIGWPQGRPQRHHHPAGGLPVQQPTASPGGSPCACCSVCSPSSPVRSPVSPERGKCTAVKGQNERSPEIFTGMWENIRFNSKDIGPLTLDIADCLEWRHSAWAQSHLRLNLWEQRDRRLCQTPVSISQHNHRSERIHGGVCLSLLQANKNHM